MSDMTLDADVQSAIEAAKAHIAPRYAGFGIEPEVYYVQACGQHIVCLPLTIQQRDAWLRQAKAQESKAADLLLKEVVFWVRGSDGSGDGAAIKYLRGLAGLGGSLSMLLEKAAGEYLRLIDETGGQATGKKL